MNQSLKLHESSLSHRLGDATVKTFTSHNWKHEIKCRLNERTWTFPLLRLSVKCNPVSSFPFPSHMFSALRSCEQTTRTAFASALYSSAPGNMNTGLISCFPAKRFRRRTYSDCFMPVSPPCRGRLPGDSQCNSVFPCVGSRLERVHHPTAWQLYRVTNISQSWCDWMQFIRSSFTWVWCAKQSHFWHETDEWINIS